MWYYTYLHIFNFLIIYYLLVINQKFDGLLELCVGVLLLFVHSDQSLRFTGPFRLHPIGHGRGGQLELGLQPKTSNILQLYSCTSACYMIAIFEFHVF